MRRRVMGASWSARLTSTARRLEARLERGLLVAGLSLVALVAEFVVTRRLR
jgi:hypothetical protein